MDVAIKNSKSGEIKNLKIGWSWTLFLFSGLLGLPLFLRGLYAWGAALLALWIVQIAVPPLLPLADQLALYLVLTLLFLGIQIFLGIKGNEMTAKNYLENNWIFADEASQAANFARQNWKLSTLTGATGTSAGAPSESVSTTINFPSGNRNPKKPLLWLLLPFGCIVIAGILWRGDMFQSTVRSAATTARGGTTSAAAQFSVGDSFRTDDFAIKIKSAQVTRRVGGELLTSEASQGAEYVAIQWAYKNITQKPISSLNTPSIHLVAPDGTVYDTDAGASASYATQVGDDTKVLSDLNPGIQSSAADVFEVSRDLFNLKTWRVIVKADRDVEVSLNQSAPAPAVSDQVAAGFPATPATSAHVTSEVSTNTTPAVTPVSTSEVNLAREARVSINVSGRSNPWDQSANPEMIYSAPGDAFPPAVVNLVAIVAGEKITLKCSGGSTNAGGVPDSGCDGLTQFEPANDRLQPACNTYYPSNFADKTTYPIYTMQILGVFATDSGAVVGKPFLVSSKEYSVTVPVGATRLQLGMNDCKNSDNSPDPLVVEIYRPATSLVVQRTAQAESTPATASPSFDCAKASSAVEKLICANPELVTADAELASFYRKNLAASGADSAPIKLGQRAFVAKRNQCSTVACVAEAYRARYEELGQLGYVRE